MHLVCPCANVLFSSRLLSLFPLCAFVTVPSNERCDCTILWAHVLLSLYHHVPHVRQCAVVTSCRPMCYCHCTMRCCHGTPRPICCHSTLLMCCGHRALWHLTLLRRGVSSSGSFSATASQLYAEGGAGAFFKVCCWCAFGVFWCVVGQSYLVTWIDQQR
jgi:hypothetical protein